MSDTVVVMFSLNENPKRCIRVPIAGSQLLQLFLLKATVILKA